MMTLRYKDAGGFDRVNARTIPIGEKRTMGIFSSTEPLGIRPKT